MKTVANYTCIGVTPSDVAALNTRELLEYLTRRSANQAYTDAIDASGPESIGCILLELENRAIRYRQAIDTDADDGKKHASEIAFDAAIIALLLALAPSKGTPLLSRRSFNHVDPFASRLLQVCYAWAGTNDLLEGARFLEKFGNRELPSLDQYAGEEMTLGLDTLPLDDALLPRFPRTYRRGPLTTGELAQERGYFEHLIARLGDHLQIDCGTLGVLYDRARHLHRLRVGREVLTTMTLETMFRIIPALSAHSARGEADPASFLRRTSQQLADASQQVLEFARSASELPEGSRLFPSVPPVALVIPMRLAEDAAPEQFCIAGHAGDELLRQSLYELAAGRLSADGSDQDGIAPAQITNDITTNLFPLDVVLDAFPDADPNTGSADTDRYVVRVNVSDNFGGVDIPHGLKDIDILVADRRLRRIFVADCKFSFGHRKYSYYRRGFNNFREGGSAQEKLSLRVDWVRDNLDNFTLWGEKTSSATWQVVGALVLNQFPAGVWLATGSLPRLTIARSKHCNELMKGA